MPFEQYHPITLWVVPACQDYPAHPDYWGHLGHWLNQGLFVTPIYFQRNQKLYLDYTPNFLYPTTQKYLPKQHGISRCLLGRTKLYRHPNPNLPTLVQPILFDLRLCSAKLSYQIWHYLCLNQSVSYCYFPSTPNYSKLSFLYNHWSHQKFHLLNSSWGPSR